MTSSGSPAHGPRSPWGLAAASGALAALVYLPILWNGFVNWDDGNYVFHPALRALDLGLLRFAVGFDTPAWHPLTWIAHALDRAAWGDWPVGHHATSILLYAGDVALLLVVARRLIAAAVEPGPGPSGRADHERFATVAAGAAGLLFAVHPTHVESVAWASGKKDLLCTLFLLLTVRSYLDAVERPGGGEAARPGAARRAYAASVGWCALALLTKPSAVTFPAVLLLLDVYPLRRPARGEGFARLVLEKVPFAALGLAVSVVTYVAHERFGDLGTLASVGLRTRLVVAASSTVAYLAHLVWPVGLLPFYPYPERVGLAAPGTLLSVAAFVAISAGCLLLARRRPALAAVWVFFLVTLLPVIGLVKMGFQEMADRYGYLPTIGPILLLGAGVAELDARAARAGGRGGVVLAAAGAAVAVALSFITVRLAPVWKNDLTLWTYQIEQAPGLSWLAYQNRGVALSKAGRLEAALADYDVAIGMNPRSAELFYNRGNARARLGRLGEAVEDYATAIALAPVPHPHYLRNRAVVLRQLGRPAEAAADWVEAQRLEALAGARGR